MRRSYVTSAVLLMTALVPVSLGHAQTPELDDETADHSSNAARPLDDRTNAGGPLADVHLNIVDQKLALSLAVDTQMQIEMGELALTSIHNEALRGMLSARLDEQRAFVAQLETLTAGRAGKALDQARREIKDDQDGNGSRRLRLLDLRRNATALLVRIRMEVLQKYSRMVCGELKPASGDDFDRHYLQCDLLNQMQMLATLEVFADQASQDFAQVLQREAATAKEQIEHTQQFALQLETLPLAGNAAAKPLVVETAAEH